MFAMKLVSRAYWSRSQPLNPSHLKFTLYFVFARHNELRTEGKGRGRGRGGGKNRGYSGSGRGGFKKKKD